MESKKGKYDETVISDNRTFSLKGKQNIYFKNLGDTEVLIGLYPLKVEQSSYIHTGDVILDKKNLDIVFKDHLGGNNSLYVRYVIIPDCICE
ncbi:hypothetical protein [Tenacibaculum maritimum]|uniref:hypothetical protein n=1 Tax=Tenacibaculum maritimum TaxID=107401 RepID=UPI0012E4D98B|nr:hypothetical protein [Tenacibaculum maritimum]CAA0215739.1 conserved hypothetical protein [Tenacibaculum maritimum]